MRRQSAGARPPTLVVRTSTSVELTYQRVGVLMTIKYVQQLWHVTGLGSKPVEQTRCLTVTCDLRGWSGGVGAFCANPTTGPGTHPHPTLPHIHDIHQPHTIASS